MIPLDIPVVAAMEKVIFKDDPWSLGQFKEEISNNGITRHYLVACDSVTTRSLGGQVRCVLTRVQMQIF
jgi:hypothetical protein